MPDVGKRQRVGPMPRLADCKSAIRQIENLRYDQAPCGRLKKNAKGDGNNRRKLAELTSFLL
jgi:hypothetical protein